MRRIFTAITILAAAMLASPTANAGATGPANNSCSGGYFTQDVCKYDQSLVALSGGTMTMYWRGATASGACDPSNNVTRWKSDGNRIYRNGVALAGYGGTGWLTNCAIPAGATTSVSRTKDAGTLVIDFFFKYTQGGADYPAGVNGHWMVS